MPNYSRQGKIMAPLSEAQFIQGMNDGHFTRQDHKAFIALLYYTGIRVSEALRSIRSQFQIDEEVIYFEVGKRLKGSLQTAPLKISLKKPFASSVATTVRNTRKGRRVFPYCRKTGYNIVSRVFYYPHHLRLTKITDLFEKGFTISQLRAWTGLTLNSLNYYVGVVEIGSMAEA